MDKEQLDFLRGLRSATSAIESSDASFRSEAGHGLFGFDSVPEPVYDQLAELAAQICRTPVAIISYLEKEIVYIKAQFGPQDIAITGEYPFIRRAILSQGSVFVIEDTLANAQEGVPPIDLGEPPVRFFAGMPIVDGLGNAIGAICVLDFEPRTMTSEQCAALARLARVANALVVARMERLVENARKLKGYQQSLVHLKAISTQSLDLKAFIDPSYIFRYVNPTYLHYWRKRADEIIGRPVAELLGVELFEATVKPLLDRAFAGGMVERETSYDFPGVGRRQMKFAYLPAVGDDGAVMGVVVRGDDISELHAREHKLATSLDELAGKSRELDEANQSLVISLARLRQSLAKVDAGEVRFRSYLMASPVGKVVTADTGVILLINSAAQSLFGYSDLELVGRVVEDLIPERHRRAHLAARTGYVHAPEFRDMAGNREITGLRKDGTEIPIEIGLAPIEMQGETRFLATITDLQKRKEALAIAEASNLLFEATFEQAAVGIAQVALDGRWVRVNRRLCEIVGYDKDALLSMTFVDITHPADIEVDLGQVRAMLDGQISTYSMEKRYIRSDGAVIWINLTVSFQRDSSGNPQHFISVIEDIDAKKKSEEKLAVYRSDLEKSVNELETKTIALERFLHILSHDMREPVNSIINFLGLLRNSDKIVAQEPESKYLQIVDASAIRLKTLLEDLLSYVRLEGKRPGTNEVDLNQLAAEINLDLSHQVSDARAAIQCDHLPVVRGDSTLLRVLMQNLVSNAIKFVARGTLPVVRIYDHGSTIDAWRIAVEDNGIGISEEDAKLLFRPFVRLNVRSQYPGTGLGLASCRRIVELHNGKIEIGRTAIEGSIFTLVLPRRDEFKNAS